MRVMLKAGTVLLMLTVAPVGIAATQLTVAGLSTPVYAAMDADWPDSVNQYVMQIRKKIKTTDMDGYLAAVKSPNGALLLDVREEGEFKAGHVPGAVNLPRRSARIPHLEATRVSVECGYEPQDLRPMPDRRASDPGGQAT